MPLDTSLKLPTETPEFSILTLDSWRKGVITLIDKSKVPKDALVEAQNLYLTEDGVPTPRPGVDWYGDTVHTSTTLTSTRTNLVTNPSFETGITPWVAYGAGALSQSTGVVGVATTGAGSNSLRIVTGGTTTQGTGSGLFSGLSANTNYIVTAYLYIPVGVTMTCEVDTYTSGGAYVASFFADPIVVGTGAWQRVSIPFITSSVATRAEIYWLTEDATTFYVDAVMMESGTAIDTYFDGSLTDTSTEVYSWTGTAHGSSSTLQNYLITGDTIDGAAMYETSAGVAHLVVVANGVVYRSTNDGVTWTACTGVTLTVGEKAFFVQDHGYLYITDGVDNIVRYDGTTTLQIYTALSTPAAPTIVETGLAGTAVKHYYKVAAVNDVGFTIASPASAVVESTLDRASWDSTTNYATVSVVAVTGAKRYDWYISNDNIEYYYLDSTIGNASTSYQDTGSAIPNTNILAPTANTTQGPKVKRLEQIGSRLWGVQDYDEPWRVWFSGAGPYAGYFSAAYDGGYIDLMKGSQYRPVRVVDYRDGKGTPYATVWCDSPDGQGCIWQVALELLTIESISITVPTAYRLPGSRGTAAPESVVNVLNDYHFYNSQAFFNLGSRAEFLNLLSTDEISANIRPTVKQISPTGAPGICAIYYDAKVLYSVPYGSETNNYTIAYDTERKAWLPEAFTIGFERFFQYVDADGDRKLLAWKTGDSKLTEISENIQGDYGEAFSTSMVTGLYPVSKNRFEFMWVEEGEVEFSQPQGTINVELIGIERSRGFSSVNTQTIETDLTTSGWSTFAWSTTPWSDTSDVPATFSESSVKRYFRVQRELNAYQWRVTTSSLDASYLARTLQLNGTVTRSGKPKQWRL